MSKSVIGPVRPPDPEEQRRAARAIASHAVIECGLTYRETRDLLEAVGVIEVAR